MKLLQTLLILNISFLVIICHDADLIEKQEKLIKEIESIREVIDQEYIDRHFKDFQNYDSDQDGELSKEEIRAAFPIVKNSLFETFFKKADKNNSNKISFSEYLDQAIDLDDRKVKTLKQEIKHHENQKKLREKHQKQNNLNSEQGINHQDKQNQSEL